MKNRLLLVLMLFAWYGAKAQATYPSGATGCIARWTFDTTETATMLTSLPDMSNNSNGGTTNNISSVNGFREKPNAAGGFNGSSSWAEVAHKVMLNVNDFTIVSLGKFHSFNSNLCQGNQILSKGYPYFISGNYGQALGDNTYDGDCNIVSPTNVSMVTQCGTVSPTFPVGNYLTLEKWYLIVSVQKPDSLLQYLAVMDTSNKLTSLTPISLIPGVYTTGSNTQNISIGKHLNPNYPYWIHADLDEVVLFNRALSSIEIYNIYSYLWGWPTDVQSQSQLASYKIGVGDHKIRVITTGQQYDLEVLDISGRMVAKQKNCFGDSEIDLSNEISGTLMIVKIIGKDGDTQFSKILIQ